MGGARFWLYLRPSLPLAPFVPLQRSSPGGEPTAVFEKIKEAFDIDERS